VAVADLQINVGVEESETQIVLAMAFVASTGVLTLVSHSTQKPGNRLFTIRNMVLKELQSQ
jgi:hypothetical protein